MLHVCAALVLCSASSPTHRRKSNSSASISRVCPVALVGWSLMEYQAGSWDGSSRTETCNSGGVKCFRLVSTAFSCVLSTIVPRSFSLIALDTGITKLTGLHLVDVISEQVLLTCTCPHIHMHIVPTVPTAPTAPMVPRKHAHAHAHVHVTCACLHVHVHAHVHAHAHVHVTHAHAYRETMLNGRRPTRKLSPTEI
jgi:hypothetical protein